ncbi:hypothetical protein ARAF_0642 [Arsenophonus endosymbiont of Aleurodicus floccissimus]|uniref:head-tail connector protein n=1 Tax=Arsenophonus endosymbiont of Aleurodicus floccissimus TaxID=2152761 RepID=UPI000ECB88BC|nr:head-tail connector protein [Arsenophonus endosymbiont of Aleurodicus floccissimus]SPP31513.1 hypothetical protein ARAF_0642 [Arsenophonus endosymbiont of Aleurodicus floccissimus]
MTMMNIVTVEEVKAHLRIDHDELDSVLQDNINAATEAVLDFVDYWVEKNSNN